MTRAKRARRILPVALAVGLLACDRPTAPTSAVVAPANVPMRTGRVSNEREVDDPATTTAFGKLRARFEALDCPTSLHRLIDHSGMIVRWEPTELRYGWRVDWPPRPTSRH
ncbi:MAG TPA: hypothetical protein VM076_05220 [Gemmatimonadaceae bacterium]|nr:hypothetical protein [Gemmatimonadaceae bacterium]